MTASLQEIEDLERKRNELEARKARIALESRATPVAGDTGQQKPTNSRMKRARDTVPAWERDD